MKHPIALLAMMLWLGLGGSAALADVYLQAIGDPVEGNSWSQTFATRAGDWTEFDAISIQITSSHSFEPPYLDNFRLATAAENKPTGSFQPLTSSWVLTTSSPTTAAAAGTTAIGGSSQKGYWLVFDAHFTDNAPSSSAEHLQFDATLSMGGQETWVHHVNYFDKGIEVRSFPCSNVVPVPAAVVLGAIGLATLGVWMRRYC